MVESNDLLKGSEFGTYKIFSQLPIKTNKINFEVDKINKRGKCPCDHVYKWTDGH